MVDAFNMTVMRPYDMTLSANGGFDMPGNLLTPQPGERSAMTGAQGGAVKFDLGSARPLQQFALLYTDGDSATNWAVLASNNEDMSNPVINSSAVPLLTDTAASADSGYRHALYHLPAPVTARYVQLQLSKPTTAGRFVAGLPLQVEYNPDYGATSWGFEEAPEPDTLDSGVTVLEELTPAPYFEFSISWASEAEMELGWQALARCQWRRVPLLVVRRPDPHAYRHSGIFWGVLRLQPFAAAEYDMFEVNGKIRSMV